MGVQKHLFVSECAVLKELLKQRASVRSCTELLYSVRWAAALKIPLAGVRYVYTGSEIIQKFNVHCLDIKNCSWAIFKRR